MSRAANQMDKEMRWVFTPLAYIPHSYSTGCVRICRVLPGLPRSSWLAALFLACRAFLDSHGSMFALLPPCLAYSMGGGRERGTQLCDAIGVCEYGCPEGMTKVAPPERRAPPQID